MKLSNEDWYNLCSQLDHIWLQYMEDFLTADQKPLKNLIRRTRNLIETFAQEFLQRYKRDMTIDEYNEMVSLVERRKARIRQEVKRQVDKDLLRLIQKNTVASRQYIKQVVEAIIKVSLDEEGEGLLKLP